VALLVWQDHHRKQWSVAVRRALTGAILARAGFVDMGFADVHEPVYSEHGVLFDSRAWTSPRAAPDTCGQPLRQLGSRRP
jgi:hypothetical protein